MERKVALLSIKYIVLILMGMIIINQIINPSLIKTVTGNSMAPLIMNGERVLLVEPIDENDLNINDIILYEYNSLKILHRIKFIAEDMNGWYVITKGDNETSNPVLGYNTIQITKNEYLFEIRKIRFNQIIGKVE